MPKDMLIIANITLDIYNAVLGIILIISTIIRHVIKRKVRIWFLIMISANIIMSIADIFTWLFEGKANPHNFIILPIAMFIFYVMAFGIIFCSGFYIINSLDKDKYRKVFKISLIVSAVIYDISLLLTPFLGLLYNIDANNIYTRGHFFIIPIIIDTLLYFHCFAYMIINRKTIHRDKVFKLQPISPPNS